MGFADAIRSLRDNCDMSQQEVADKVGVSRVTVTKWENGQTEPRGENAVKLASLFGVSVAQLLGYDSASLPSREIRSGAPAMVPMMVLGSVHAGEFDEEAVSEGDWVGVPAEVAERWPHARAVRARGTCMDRVIPDGHWFVYDPDTEPRNGDIAVVETEDYEAVVRRWYRGGDTLMLVADSHGHHEDIVIHWEDGAVRVIGTVVYEQGYLRE